MSRRATRSGAGPQPTAAKDRRNFAAYRAEKHALRSKVARAGGPAMRKLMRLSIETEQDMATTLDGYKQLATMRRAAYREHARGMKIGPDLGAIIGDLAKKFGPKVKVWHNVVDWTVAILVARYGEAPEHWPREFSADDAKRAREMLNDGRALNGVTPLDRIAASPSELRAISDRGQTSNNEPMLLLGIDED